MSLPDNGFKVHAGTKVCDFLLSKKEVNVILGPLGSGKTRGLCARVMLIAQQQQKSPRDGYRYTRHAMIRNTLPDLTRTTIRTWLDMFPENLHGRYVGGAVKQHRMRFNDVVADVDFISLDKEDDVSKLRSTEYTTINFNELPFMEKVLFDEAFGRLRYPGPEHGGPTYRGIAGDGNAPDEDSWLAMMTGMVDLPPDLTSEQRREYEWPPEWGLFVQPPAVLEEFDDRGDIIGYKVNPDAENLANLPDVKSDRPGFAYYQDQLRGKSKAWIDSRLMVRTVLVVAGSPVWPMFRREFHVSRTALQPNPNYEVTIALDFGRVYPAALFSQEINQRVMVQHELLGFNEPASVFAPRVKRFLEQNYTGCKFRCVGDPKGRDKGQQTDLSSYDVFRSHGLPVSPAPVKGNNIELRTEVVANALNDNPSGISRLLISPLCRTLIVGMAGRYHLVREEDGELRPKKDKYSNLCDCLQYKLISLGQGRRMLGLTPGSAPKPTRYNQQRRTMRRAIG